MANLLSQVALVVQEPHRVIPSLKRIGSSVVTYVHVHHLGGAALAAFMTMLHVKATSVLEEPRQSWLDLRRLVAVAALLGIDGLSAWFFAVLIEPALTELFFRPISYRFVWFAVLAGLQALEFLCHKAEHRKRKSRIQVGVQVGSYTFVYKQPKNPTCDAPDDEETSDSTQLK
jgi:hypothetical protein